MRHEIFGQLFEIGRDILNGHLHPVTKVALLQYGDSTMQQVDGDGAEMWQASGVFSLPAAATQGAASSQGIGLIIRGRVLFFGFRDTRAAKNSADIAPGDSSIVGTGAACNPNNGRVVARGTGALELRTTVGIDLGGGATDAVSLASKVDAINANLKTVAQALGALTPVPASGITAAQLSALVAAANALAGGIATVASALIKAK